MTEGSRGQEERWGLAQAWGTSRKVRPKYRKGRENRTRHMLVTLNFQKLPEKGLLFMVLGLVEEGEERERLSWAGVVLQGALAAKRHMFASDFR